MKPDRISIIVPVLNGGTAFRQCLDGLCAAQPAPWEIIVVDDGSTDDSVKQAHARNLQVLWTEHARSGPAVARNSGAARARGEILFFLDADVVIHPDAVARVAAAFEDENVSAIFGSYDDSPAADTFISQYKNLSHHYVHQTSRGEATSFWAGCGAIRKNIFEQMGGFAAAYARPSIEDIELGYRLRRAGYRIQLVKGLQVKHLKKWTLASLLKTDIFDRALPWAELIVRERALPRDLNLQTSHRISAVLCFLLLLALASLALSPLFALVVITIILALVTLNFDLYRFFFLKRGLLFTLAAIPLHWLYYLYSSAAFAYVILMTTARKLRQVPPQA